MSLRLKATGAGRSRLVRAAIVAGAAAVASLGAWAWHRGAHAPIVTRDAAPHRALPPKLARRFDPGAKYGVAPSTPSTPLPEEPALAAWVLAAERALYPTLELLYLDAQLAEFTPSPWGTAPAAKPSGDAETIDVAALGKAIEERARPLFASVESSGLLEDDPIRRRAREVMAAIRSAYDPVEAGHQAEAWGLLDEASRYYRAGGDTFDEARVDTIAHARVRDESADTVGSVPPALAPFMHKPAAGGYWSCRAFTPDCLAALPPNARVRRAFALAFTPAPSCGNSSPQEGYDVAEPLLRATAEAAPEEFGRTFAFLTYLSRRAIGWRGRGAPSGDLPGDFGESQSALRVARDLFRANPEGAAPFARIVRDVAGTIEGGAGPRWAALLAYLDEGAPDPGGDEAWPTLAALLARGTPRERRWALGWVGQARRGHLDLEPSREELARDAALTAAITEAALRAEDDDDRALAMRALVAFPSEAALPAITRAVQGAAWRDATRALEQLFGLEADRKLWGELPPPWGSRWQRAPLSPALLQARDALHQGLAPHVCASDAAAFGALARLDDPGLDEITAACFAARPPGWTPLAHLLGREAPAHPTIGWTATERELRRWAERGATPFEVESVTKMADDIAAARPKALGDSANPGTDTRRRRLAVPAIETSRAESWPLPD
jgi:hypothetical protein